MSIKRIMIMGSAGSGKSTLARALSEKTGIEAIHLDSVFWKPGWVMTEKHEQNHIHDGLVEKDEWIIEGNYCETLEKRAQSVDLAIYLDMPLSLCMYRVIKRYLLNRGKSRPDMAEGCPEKIDMEFIKYILYYHREKKYKDLDLLHRYADYDKIIMLKGKDHINQFLETFSRDYFMKTSA